MEYILRVKDAGYFRNLTFLILQKTFLIKVSNSLHAHLWTDMVAKVKYDVYTCLTTIHTKRHKDGELVYPYLRTLLHFDTQGLLNVLSIAFEEPEFQSELGKCQKQRLVDNLLEIMVHQDSSRNSFSPSQVSQF